MPKITAHAKILRDWDALGAVDANASLLPGVDDLKAAMEKLLADGRAAKVQQASLGSSRQAETQNVNQIMSDGQEMARKLRAFVFSHRLADRSGEAVRPADHQEVEEEEDRPPGAGNAGEPLGSRGPSGHGAAGRSGAGAQSHRLIRNKLDDKEKVEMTKSKSLPNLIQEWEQLLTAVAAHSDDLEQVEACRAKLEAEVADLGATLGIAGTRSEWRRKRRPSSSRTSRSGCRYLATRLRAGVSIASACIAKC